MNSTDLTPLPARPSLEQYKKQAKDFVKACKSGDSQARQRVKKYHPRAGQLIHSNTWKAELALADAQRVIAREHGFGSWPKFVKHLEGLGRQGSTVAKFESAAEAIVAGDVATLERLLRESPELIGDCSARVHGATLLHYVGANGFENYRQRTPKNAVEVVKMLLKAGAEVDAVAEIYGKSTTLSLVASSVHPERAGVQIALLETLLEYGAAVDGAPGGVNPLIAALHNGRGEAAEFLAERGARLNLEGAAGVGRLDLVESFFNEDGSLKANATNAQMESGFMWACEYGRNSVVDFLLQKGVDLLTRANTGETGLHWAVIGRQLDTIKLLLKRGAPLEARNVYGGTALGQALWSAINGDPAIDYVPTIETLIEAGAEIDPGLLTWLAQRGGSSSVKAHLEEVLRRHGAKS
ncbi:MAG: ankyrin repeat domain-containing protein [Terriglobia bacterium]|jgi:ankyrin repeat protein